MKSEMPKKSSPLVSVLAGILSLLSLPLAAQQIDRTVLPIPDPQPPTITELDARNAKPPPRFELKAPKGAPNVVVVLLDDMGFGQSSAFGGPCHMPNLEKLAENGLRLNNFHTTALCSPYSHRVTDGTQSSCEQRRRDHGTRHGISWQHRDTAAERGAGGRDAAFEWI
jgi:hypothetical protein